MEMKSGADQNLPEPNYLLLKNIFAVTAVLWTVITLSVLLWGIHVEKKQATRISLSQARSFFTQIVTTRLWNSKHGGVYVPVTDTTKPNPYLDVPHRDVTTLDGKFLTLVNPAYMTRQIADIAATREQVQFHITSLNPIRPKNRADAWETGALSSFSGSSTEYYDWWPEKGEMKFRYMAPLWVDRSCLKCHAKQGYQAGDLRGGISVLIPANDILAARTKSIRAMMMGYVLIWLLGMIGGLSAYGMISREYGQRLTIIHRLSDSIREIRTLKGLIPICASCKNVRNDEGYWDQIEEYIRQRSDVDFSHGICPDCMKKLYPEFIDKNDPDEGPVDE